MRCDGNCFECRFSDCIATLEEVRKLELREKDRDKTVQNARKAKIKQDRAEYHKIYRQEHKDELRAYMKQWRAEHPNYMREHYEKYRDERLEYQSNYRKEGTPRRTSPTQK